MIFTIEEIRNRTMPIIEKYRIPAMYLFGSYARGEATEDSDLDFLVDTTGTDLTSLLKLGALYCDLENAFGKQIDLLTFRAVLQQPTMESGQDLKQRIMKEMVRLDDAFLTEKTGHSKTKQPSLS